MTRKLRPREAYVRAGDVRDDYGNYNGADSERLNRAAPVRRSPGLRLKPRYERAVEGFNRALGRAGTQSAAVGAAARSAFATISSTSCCQS